MNNLTHYRCVDSSKRLKSEEALSFIEIQMRFGSAKNIRKISSVDKDILVGSYIISTSIISTSSVSRFLGVFFDSELNMKSHISE